MADDKAQKDDGKPAPTRKRGLPPIVLVAAGAVLGGAGVTFAVPQHKVEVHRSDADLVVVPIQHPDLIEFQFNPRTQAGKVFASMAFRFVYEVREDREQEAFESIKAHWDRARSNVLSLLRMRTLAELNAANGQQMLDLDLVTELDAALFPKGPDGKVATVTEILWHKWIVQ